jgi:hypothetical protein
MDAVDRYYNTDAICFWFLSHCFISLSFTKITAKNYGLLKDFKSFYRRTSIMIIYVCLEIYWDGKMTA